MSITVTCPSCAGRMAAPVHAAGRKGKCPKCGQVLVIPSETGPADEPDWPDDHSPYAPPATLASASGLLDMNTAVPAPLAAVSGRPATAWTGRVFRPAWYGRTTLTLLPNRLVERTQRLVSRRECQIRLSEVDSAEIITSGNPTWLVLGFATLTLVVGLIFFVLYFVLKHRFLIIRSRANSVVVSLSGDEQPYRQFIETVLTEVELARAPIQN